MDSETILQLFYARDERAIVLAQEQYGALCRHVISAVLKSEEDREECMNDTFFQLWNNIPPAYPDNLRAYVCRIARCKALDRCRFNTRQKRGGSTYEVIAEELEQVLVQPGFEQELLDASVLKDVMQAFVRQLSERDRAVFLRRYWYFEKIRDIAASTGLPVGTVKHILYSCRKQLSERLKKEEIEL